MSLEAGNKIAKRKSIPAFALWGAVGFGIGGAIGGSIWPLPEYPPFAALAVMGAVGGLSLGLLLSSRAKAGLLAVACAVGFSIGSLPLALSLMGMGEMTLQGLNPISIIVETVFVFILGAIQGFVGAALMGLVLSGQYKVRCLIRYRPLVWALGGSSRTLLGVSSAMGFAVGAQASWGMAVNLPGTIIFGVWGMVGGAALGAALGYLKTREPHQSGEKA